jgi:pyridoxine 5-phosphate synthase
VTSAARTVLSVNLNKVALLRNARGGRSPSVSHAAELCLRAGAGGITLHPRPDQRHARASDVLDLAALVREKPGTELNIEGNPFPDFISLVRQTRPSQCTLVPDSVDVLTSDHGWDLVADGARLRPLIRELQDLGIRVSLFMEPDACQMQEAKAIGTDRIELYTESYASACGTDREFDVLNRFVHAAAAAQALGLGVNAGHDLNLQNLGLFCRKVPGLQEVSIGHALIAHAFDIGLGLAVGEYLQVLSGQDSGYAAPAVLDN